MCLNKTFTNTYYQPDIYDYISNYNDNNINKKEKFYSILKLYNPYEIVELVKKDIHIISIFKQNAPIYYILHLLFGTNEPVDWFDPDLFVDVCKVLNQKELHFMYEIFGHYPDIFTRKDELKKQFFYNELTDKNDFGFLMNCINYFNLTEEEENKFVEALHRKKLIKFIDYFNNLNLKYESSKTILKRIRFLNALMR